MRRHRFFIKEKLKASHTHRVSDGDLLHQMRDVFRLGTGDEVIFFDGGGEDVLCTIQLLTKKEGVFVEQSRIKSLMPKKKTTLLMSLIKKDNFELVLEKGTEIGVTCFVPIITERTLSKNINFERAQKIVQEASEQCGRGDVPTITEIKTLGDVLKQYNNMIAFDMDGDEYAIRVNEVEAQILIGPEGGWTETEIALFKKNKISIFKMGDTVLRAETAAIVASAKTIIS